MATTVNETAVKGLLGTKIGMTQVWDADNRVVPVTAVQAGPCVVTAIRTPDTDGYAAVQLAFGAIDPRKVTRPEKGHFAKAGVSPRRHVAEIRTADAAEYELGQEITVEVLEACAAFPDAHFVEDTAVVTDIVLDLGGRRLGPEGLQGFLVERLAIGEVGGKSLALLDLGIDQFQGFLTVLGNGHGNIEAFEQRLE